MAPPTLALPRAADLHDLIDTDRYPLDRADDPTLRAIVDDARRDLARTGCARLSGFVRPEAHHALEAEVAAVAPLAHTASKRVTVYSDEGADGWPEGHPRRRLLDMSNGFVTRDQIPETALVQQLHRAPAFGAFVAACLSRDRIFPFADPMRGLVANIMTAGDELPWHFDANEFVVSVMTRRPRRGGTFEYCPAIRAAGDERYEDVQAVLDGDRTRIHHLDLEVGDLQIFAGRYAMHRVTPSADDRHTVVFGFSEIPGYVGDAATARLVYGRARQEHVDADLVRHDDGLAGR